MDATSPNFESILKRSAYVVFYKQRDFESNLAEHVGQPLVGGSYLNQAAFKNMQYVPHGVKESSIKAQPYNEEALFAVAVQSQQHSPTKADDDEGPAKAL